MEINLPLPLLDGDDTAVTKAMRMVPLKPVMETPMETSLEALKEMQMMQQSCMHARMECPTKAIEIEEQNENNLDIMRMRTVLNAISAKSWRVSPQVLQQPVKIQRWRSG